LFCQEAKANQRNSCQRQEKKLGYSNKELQALTPVPNHSRIVHPLIVSGVARRMPQNPVGILRRQTRQKKPRRESAGQNFYKRKFTISPTFMGKDTCRGHIFLSI
jgi:hypothetical protein